LRAAAGATTAIDHAIARTTDIEVFMLTLPGG
jgi:hypothetical protein